MVLVIKYGGFLLEKKHALRLNQSNELLLLILDDQIIVI